jgi:hypothetical protein
MKNRQHQIEEKPKFQLRSVFLLVSMSIMCVSFNGTDKHNDFDLNSQVLSKNVEELTLKEFKNLNLSYCDTFNFEILDIYGEKDTTSHSPIYLFLDNDLKAQGFKVTNVSRGNFQYGWRFIQMDLIKDECECVVIKKYWDYEIVQDSSKMITEQIICNQEVRTNFKLN